MMADNPQYLYLTTTGWKTGKAHRIEIWYVDYQGCYYLVSEYPKRSHWVQNIQHTARVTFSVGERAFAGTARVVDSVAEPALVSSVSELMDRKYNWSDGTIVELKPD